jgi:hypothetical protein
LLRRDGWFCLAGTLIQWQAQSVQFALAHARSALTFRVVECEPAVPWRYDAVVWNGNRWALGFRQPQPSRLWCELWASQNPRDKHTLESASHLNMPDGSNLLGCADTKTRSLKYHIWVLDKEERAIRVLEVEAEMNEAQAKRFAELASYVNVIDDKLKLEALSAEALEKAVEIRSRVWRMRSSRRNW